MIDRMDADAIVVGAGLAGLVATAELIDAGSTCAPAGAGAGAVARRPGPLVVRRAVPRRLARAAPDGRERLPRPCAAGLARQRRLRPRRRHWPRVGRGLPAFAAGEKRAWLHAQGVRFFPVVGWAERGGGTRRDTATRFRASISPGVPVPVCSLRSSAGCKRVSLRPGRATGFGIGSTSCVVEGAVTGVRGGPRTQPGCPRRGQLARSSGDFELAHRPSSCDPAASAATTNSSARLARAARHPAAHMLSGVPRMSTASCWVSARRPGPVHQRRPDVALHRGIENCASVWAGHGIRILPGPSSLWLDATGSRLPSACSPDSTPRHAGSPAHHGADHSWFVLTQKIIEKEFALSGCEQNPDLTNKGIRQVSKGSARGRQARSRRSRRAAPTSSSPTPSTALDGMNALTRLPLDSRASTPDPGPRPGGRQRLQQGPAGHGDPGRARIPRRQPHQGRRATPAPRPLGRPADRGHAAHLTRKTLGGIETDLDGRALRHGGGACRASMPRARPAASAAAACHGYRALEGTFLGGCLYSGRRAGRAVAAATA